jgi:Holliday junction DNA helicase RuvA
VVVEVAGVGLQVFVPAPASLGAPGDQVRLHTHLVVREEELSLYGFSDEGSLRLFQLLLGVSRVGPRLALAVLTGAPLEVLVQAIATEDGGALSATPGVGRRTADRIILELKGKLEAAPGLPAAVPGDGRGDVVGALEALGYSPTEARQAAASLPQDSSLSLEEQVRQALQRLAGGS